MLETSFSFLTSIYSIGLKEIFLATLIFAVIYISGLLKTAKHERDFYRNNRDKYFKKWKKERDIRLAFQKGLGLPVSNMKECYESLWARAGNGDEDSEYIVLELTKLDIDRDNLLNKTKYYQKKHAEKKISKQNLLNLQKESQDKNPDEEDSDDPLYFA